MKRISQNINNKTLVFSRWSRKAFASFYSIGKCVIIAKVKKEIADASLSKNVSCSDYPAYSNCTLLAMQEQDNIPLEEDISLNELLIGIFKINIEKKSFSFPVNENRFIISKNQNKEQFRLIHS